MAIDIFSGKRSHSDWSCGIGDEMGSVIFTKSDQRALYSKLDDVRYDLRSTKNTIGAGVFAIAGGLAFLGIASVYRTSSKNKRASL